MNSKTRLKELKEKQKELLSETFLDLEELNKVNKELYIIRMQRYNEKLKHRQEEEEKRQLARINAIFEK